MPLMPPPLISPLRRARYLIDFTLNRILLINIFHGISFRHFLITDAAIFDILRHFAIIYISPFA